MAPTIGDMTGEIRANNIAKGWRCAAGGPGQNTLGDYVALLHTEVSEALEAYRDHRLTDPTIPGGKPEGVGSELADVLIRLLDTGDVFGFEVFEMDLELGDVAELDPAISDPDLPALITFGDHMAWLSRRVDRIWTQEKLCGPRALRALVTTARKFGIDLEFEYARKVAYNRTRPYRHGGRALSDANA